MQRQFLFHTWHIDSLSMEIFLKDISKSFGSRKVIDQISLRIGNGFTTLLGSSGCGKTTLLRMISGLESPDEGEIWFSGRCVFSKEKGIDVPPEKRGLGFVFQDFALWPHMSVSENVAFGLRARGEKEGIREKTMAALSAVRLQDYAESYPSQLSGGQQQRVAFARAIVIEPECILFDEPLSALDALLREEMREELSSLISRLGITAVFVTHDQEEAMSMSTEIALLREGIVEQCGSPESIYEHPATPFAAHFIGASNWIDERTMFRPENASLSPCGDAERFDCTIERSIFLGDRWSLKLRYGDAVWSIASRETGKTGEKLSIYVKRSNIIHYEVTR